MAARDTFLFDLDGTLLDTHEDMGNALNRTLAAHDRPPLPMQDIRPFVSRGGMVLVCLAFHCRPGSDEATALWREFLDHYAGDVARHTHLFDGMADVLGRIEGDGHRWGIVTNKPGFLTEPLLDALGLLPRAACVVSGDTLPQRKPDPEPLRYACRQAGTAPGRALFVGDDERDVQAGRAAGIVTLAAAWGFIVDEDDPADWQADAIVARPADLLAWL